MTKASFLGVGILVLSMILLGLHSASACPMSGNSGDPCNVGCFTPDSLGDNLPETILSNNEKSLQSILDGSGYFINVNTDQAEMQLWKANKNVELEITYIDGITSYGQVFGYYKKGDLNSFVPIFKTMNHSGFENTPAANPGEKFNITLESGDEIGFAIDVEGFFYDSGKIATEKYLNAQQQDQVISFDLLSEFILGFEDTFRDWDYQDVVVSIKIKNCNLSAPVCGNNILEEGEQCDDGNLINGDGCSSTCTIEPIACSSNLDCGTNFDSGNFCSANNVTKNHTSFTCNNPGTSQAYCSSSTNQIFVEECSHMCMDGVCHAPPSCGNGALECGEQCDDGALNGIICHALYGESCNYCSNTCQISNILGPYCGDRIINGQETCDDGNSIEGDGCSSDCTIEIDNSICGNGIKEAGEQCDTGLENGVSCDNSHESCSYCSLSCKVIDKNKKNNNKKDSSENINFVDLTTSFCSVDWICSGWSECTGGIQTRTCKDSNNCALQYDKPIEKTSCSIKNALVEEPKGNSLWIWILIALIIIAIIVILVNWNEM